MKRFLLIAFVLLLATAAHAQGVRIGLKGGANYSNISGDLGSDDIYDSKLSLHGGVMLNFRLIEDFLSLQPEILYSNKGYTFSDTPYTWGANLTYRNEGRVSYNYIDVPILAKVKAGALFFELGPQASYLIGVRKDYRETFNLAGIPTTIEYTDKDMAGLTRFELGYVAGLGFQTTNGVMLGGRYNGNLSKIVKEQTYFDGRLGNARHSVFQLYLGFLIGE